MFRAAIIHPHSCPYLYCIRQLYYQIQKAIQRQDVCDIRSPRHRGSRHIKLPVQKILSNRFLVEKICGNPEFAMSLTLYIFRMKCNGCSRYWYSTGWQSLPQALDFRKAFIFKADCLDFFKEFPFFLIVSH